MLFETLFKSFNNNNTKWEKEKKRQEQIKRKKKIGYNISDIVFVIIKWKTINNNTNKKGEKD